MDEAPANVSRDRGDPAQRTTPWAQLRFVTFQPHIFPRMLGPVSPDAKTGDLVTVYDKNGQRIGRGRISGTGGRSGPSPKISLPEVRPDKVGVVPVGPTSSGLAAAQSLWP